MVDQRFIALKRKARYECFSLFNLIWSHLHYSDNQSVANLIFKFLIEFLLEPVYIRHIFDVGFRHSCLGKRRNAGVVGRQDGLSKLFFGFCGSFVILLKVTQDMGGNNNICDRVKSTIR